jgi:hypothetical protein
VSKLIGGSIGTDLDRIVDARRPPGRGVEPARRDHVVFTFQWGPFSRLGSASLRGYRTMPLGLMVAVPLRGPQKRDFSHAGTASTAVRMLRTRPNRMKPGFHRALTR